MLCSTPPQLDSSRSTWPCTACRTLAAAGCPVSEAGVHGSTLEQWLGCLVGAVPHTWPTPIGAGFLALAAALLECATAERRRSDATPCKVALWWLTTALALGSTELLRLVIGVFAKEQLWGSGPGGTVIGHAVELACERMCHELLGLQAPEVRKGGRLCHVVLKLAGGRHARPHGSSRL